MSLRAEQEGLIPLPHLLLTRATVVAEGAEPVVLVTTPRDGCYMEDHQGRRCTLRFKPRRQRQHWLAQLLSA